MSVRILRSGSTGDEVIRWQTFLTGKGFLRAPTNGSFDRETDRATRAYQRANKLAADGIVGPATFAAALGAGFDIGFVDPERGDAEPLLPEASPVKPISSTAERQELFGKFDYLHAPTSSNREAITIVGDWVSANIQTVVIPQLKGIPVYGKPGSGKVRFHRRVIPQLQALWVDWENAGLLNRVLSYEGAFEPRFVRGSNSLLSNHAFGSAFDINAQWNSLGSIPAAAGREGSVRELVAIANEHGFFWGGHYATRKDGMHFEVAEIR